MWISIFDRSREKQFPMSINAAQRESPEFSEPFECVRAAVKPEGQPVRSNIALLGGRSHLPERYSLVQSTLRSKNTGPRIWLPQQAPQSARRSG